jgi:hypothetical protein
MRPATTALDPCFALRPVPYGGRAPPNTLTADTPLASREKNSSA